LRFINAPNHLPEVVRQEARRTRRIAASEEHGHKIFVATVKTGPPLTMLSGILLA
jgi:hypothetical protein